MEYNKSIKDLDRGDNIYRREGEGALSLSSFFNQVYGWMSLGLAVTAVIAYALAQNEELVRKIFSSQITFFAIVIVQFLIVMGVSRSITKISMGVAALGFLAYAALNGVIFSIIFMIYTQASIATTFGVTAVTFGVTSFIGMVTRRDLSGFGGFFTMALIGFIVGSVVNLFWQNSAFYWLLTYVGIIIFAGLMVYDTNKLKRLASEESGLSGGALRKIALLGALTLYLDFINMFLLLLRIFGRGRD